MLRKPFSAILVGETITFDSGYYMTGHITRDVGTHNGKRMVHFRVDGADSDRIISYAAHRSVVMMPMCLCCDFGAHDMPCDCDGKSCCHPENH